MTRQHALETAFCDIPSRCGPYPLRPLSASSYTLLARLGNPMISGGDTADQAALFEAVLQYVWIHSAPIDRVAAIRTRDDLPATEINLIGYDLAMADVFGFLAAYGETARRITLAMAEADQAEAALGKPATPVTAPVGLPLSSMPLAQPETPPASDTFFGGPRSSVPWPTSTPPTVPQEPSAAGPIPQILTLLPSHPPAADSPTCGSKP